eukprot:TRINITY_DN45468_c0_g1_i1.p3 TRINITY_DN45468_c0_g1~~TRINITY_DN45468_c0_g1_i1.p3  ORF type:complete len:194 (-),score=14.99 TRINITY_DN45468_c0_g1_i1:515-1096(-)
MVCTHTTQETIKSGNLFMIRFMRDEESLEHAKKAVTSYVAKYVLKHKGEHNLEYRAVKSALNLRPFTTSRNLFSRTLLRKVKNDKGEKLYKNYSIFELTKKMLNGEIQIVKTPLEHTFIGQKIEINKVGEFKFFEHWDGEQKLRLKDVGRIDVHIDDDVYSWEAGQYYIAQKEWVFDEPQEEKELTIEAPFVL